MKYIRFKKNEIISYGLLSGKKIEALDKAPWLDEKKTGEEYQLEDVSLLSPCLPGKIIAVAVNYPGTTNALPDSIEPLVFLMATNSIADPNTNIIIPFEGTKVWGEPELALVIGKRLKNCTLEEAEKALYGYTIANDITSHNINQWDHHLARSKAVDNFCPLGPYIETQYDPYKKEIKGYQNGNLVRKGRLDDRFFREPNLIQLLSSWITIEPGDVILTGTPGRIGERFFISKDTVYRCEIEGLGSLENSFSLINQS